MGGNIKTCSLLLTNDEPAVIATVHAARGTAPHRLIVGPITKAAVVALTEQRCRFEELLVDVTGDLTGLHRIESIRSYCSRVPIIALVPSDSWLLKERAFLRGVAGLVDTPVGTEELGVAVRESCGCGSRRLMRRSLRATRRLVNWPGEIRR